LHWRDTTRGVRREEIFLREESLLAIAFQTVLFHREVPLLRSKEEIKGQVLQGIQGEEQGYHSITFRVCAPHKFSELALHVYPCSISSKLVIFDSKYPYTLN